MAGNYLTEVMADALSRGYTITIETRTTLCAWGCVAYRVVVSNAKYFHAKDIRESMLDEKNFRDLINDMIAYIERVEDVKRRAMQ